MNDIRKPLGIVVSLVVVALLIGMLAPSVISGFNLLERKSEGETRIDFYEYENQTFDVDTTLNTSDAQINETSTINNETYDVGIAFYDTTNENVTFVLNDTSEDEQYGFNDTNTYTYSDSNVEINYEVTFHEYNESADTVRVDAEIETVEYTTEWDSDLQNLVGLFSIFTIVGIVIVIIKSAMEVY